MMNIEGKQVLVIGGSRGIGLKVAQSAAEIGAQVTIMARNPETLALVESQLKNVSTISADIREPNELEDAVGQLTKIDHIYISAGRFVGGGPLENTLEHYRSALDERVWGSLNVIRAAHAKLTETSSIVLTGGVSTARPAKGAWATSIATAAAENMARALAVELAPIRVNAISPGWTDTPMWDEILGDAKSQTFGTVGQGLLTERIALPEEAANAVIFLFSNESITGEVIHIDGGGRLV